MKNAISRLLLVALALSMLSACGKKVDIETVDQNQSISRDNATLNARRFCNARFPQYTQVIVDSDSTISPSCRFGDGRASGKVYQDGKLLAKIKCQTNGHGKGLEGCLLEDEFKTKDYAKEDGVCQDLPALAKFK